MQKVKQADIDFDRIHNPDTGKFDLTVHHRDPRGRLLGKNPYRLHVRNGTKLYERPVGSGNLWYEGGQPAGRVEVTLSDDGLNQSKKFDLKAEHKAYQKPMAEDEKVIAQNEQLRKRNEDLKKELAAIQGERQQTNVETKATTDGGTAEQAASAPTPAPAPVTEARKPSGQPISNYKEML